MLDPWKRCYSGVKSRTAEKRRRDESLENGILLQECRSIVALWSQESSIGYMYPRLTTPSRSGYAPDYQFKVELDILDDVDAT